MKRYQRIIALFAQAFLVMLVLASCAKDKSLVGTEEIPGGSGDAPRPYGGMLYIRLFTDGGVVTRGDDGDLVADEPEHEHESGDLVNGSDAEHAIGTFGNYVIFFDKEKKYYGISELTLTKDTEFDHGGHQREAIYGARIEATVNENAANDEEAEVWPSWCLVVLNGQDIVKVSDDSQTLAGEPLTGKSLDDVLNIAWTYEANSAGTAAGPYTTGVNASGFGKNSDGLFVMTNAVYLKGNEVYAATEIPDDLIQEGGAAIDKDKILFVHVERMLAKFDFSIKPADGVNNSGDNNEIFQPSITPDIVLFDGFESDGSPKFTAKRWRMEVTGWGINAIEESSYPFKKISPDANYFPNWNDASNYRAYWAECCTYDAERYPWQYRNPGYESAANVPYYSATGTDAAGVTNLVNYSFDALDLNKKEAVDADTDAAAVAAAHFGRVLYAPESTYNTTKVAGKHDGRDEMLAATHLLVGAELQIELDRTGHADVYEAIDIYRERSGFFYLTERDCFAVMVHAFNQLLLSQKSMDYVYYKWDGGIVDGDSNDEKFAAKPAEIETSENYYNGKYDFGLYWVKDNVYTLLDDAFFSTRCQNQEQFKAMFGGLADGNLPGGDGQRLPWPIQGRLVICNTDKVPVDIYTRDKILEGEKIERTRKRPANDNDVKSLLYEWLGAVDHFNDGRMYYACGIDNPASPTDQTHKYGTVRNSWYQFNLKSVSGLGVPVDDPTQPIVPDRSTPNDQINVTVSILEWHTVETVWPDNTPVNPFQ